MTDYQASIAQRASDFLSEVQSGLSAMISTTPDSGSIHKICSELHSKGIALANKDNYGLNVLRQGDLALHDACDLVLETSQRVIHISESLRQHGTAAAASEMEEILMEVECGLSSNPPCPEDEFSSLAPM